MRSFTDIVVCMQPEITISYRSGMMVFEEGLRDGAWVALSYSANGHLMAANSVPAPSYMNIGYFSQPQSFQLNVDGQDMISHWSWGGIDIQREEGKATACVTLKHSVRPIHVRIHTLLDGTAVMKRSIEVINMGSTPAALSGISPLSGGVQQIEVDRHHLNVMKPLYRLGYMKNTVWGKEGSFHWQDLPDEIYTIAGRYRRDRHRHPMFVLENLRTGETFIAQMAWSGGYAFTFDFNREVGTRSCMSMNLAMDSPAPMRMIEPGEKYMSPSVHIGVVFGGLDPAIQEMHEHMRKSVFLPPTRGISGWVEAGIGPEYEMDVESTKKSLEHAHSVGAEIFFIDAGWYLEPHMEKDWHIYCGDWQFNANRYPNGIEEIRNLAHSKGMLFGMWMDADRIGRKSKVYQEHGDWLATNYNGKHPACGLLNLADPEVSAWMEQQIRFLLDEYKIDMFRLDHNVSAKDAIAYNERDGYLENTYARYYENVYSVYKRLRKDYPDVIFENCAGGGGRTDLGLTAHFTHTWVTDWQIHPGAFCITNGMTMALPPECVDRLIGGQNAYITADMRTLIRNLIFARPTIGCFKPHWAEANPQQMEIIRHHVDIYKNFVRPMQRDSLIYHHTPDLDQAFEGFGILETAKRDRTQGLIGIFRLAEPRQESVVVVPRGIDPAKTYSVVLDNLSSEYVISGGELFNHGLCVRLGSALTSELILYRAI